MKKSRIIYTLIDEKGYWYSSISLSCLAEAFGYNNRAGEYWKKKLGNKKWIKVKGLYLVQSDYLEDTRGGKNEHKWFIWKGKTTK